jgi:hypothetical protein
MPLSRLALIVGLVISGAAASIALAWVAANRLGAAPGAVLAVIPGLMAVALIVRWRAR